MTFSRTLYILPICWWPAVIIAVSPCDLSTIFVQLHLEQHIQVFKTAVDDKTKGLKRKIHSSQFVDSGLYVM